jgi:selenocysteine lyase/cysteine desulfurase
MPDVAMDISRRDFLRHSAVAALSAPLAASLPAEWHKLAEGTDDEHYWRLVKRQFFLEDGLIFLNSGTYGPTLRTVYEATARNFFEQGQNYIAQFRKNYLGEAVPNFMRKVAEFVGANYDEIALTSGTTEAMNYIASGLDLKPGDEVLTTLHEHQGGLYPWLLKAKRFGLKVIQVPLPTAPESHTEILEQITRALTPRTRVLSFCHLNYTDGTVMPVRELCDYARRRGIITVVDGAQSLGMLNFKIRALGCDFFAASFHKWMCAPYGTGLLYVREERRDRHWPTTVMSFTGWDNADRNGNPGFTDITYASNYPKALVKYSSNLEYYGNLYWTIALAIDFHHLLGRDRIEKRIRTLAGQVKTGLQAMPGVTLFSATNPATSSGLVSFRLAKMKTSDLYYWLSRERKIVGRFIQHPSFAFDVNRFSTNIFNLPEEVEAALAALREKL